MDTDSLAEDLDLEDEDELENEDLSDETEDDAPEPTPAPKRGRPKGKTPKAAKNPPAKKTAKPKAEPKAEKPKAERKPVMGAPMPARALLNKEELAKTGKMALTFKQASDPTRLAVVAMLHKHEEVHVGAICASLNQSQPAVSHHLALLRHAGIVEPRRQGKNNFYSLTEKGQQIGELFASC